MIETNRFEEMWFSFLSERTGLALPDIMKVLEANDLFWETHPLLLEAVWEDLENE